LPSLRPFPRHPMPQQAPKYLACHGALGLAHRPGQQVGVNGQAHGWIQRSSNRTAISAAASWSKSSGTWQWPLRQKHALHRLCSDSPSLALAPVGRARMGACCNHSRDGWTGEPPFQSPFP
jgi:hypothetical protein